MKSRIICFILGICMVASLTGCATKNSKNAEKEKLDKIDFNNEEEVEKEEIEEEETEPLRPTISVSTVEEFIDAIGPNVIINVEPGYYNLSEYIDEMWNAYEQSWNNAHPYACIRECYDGVELLIQFADNLTITGNVESLANTEIVVEPRYAGVLNFLNCKNLNISNLTLGHTETGACSGNVVNFFGCTDVNISHSDFYGCGVYGIEADYKTGGLYVKDTIIRECSEGPLALDNCKGKIEFRNCIFKDSEGGGYYYDNGISGLAFYECEFGVMETRIWSFYEDVVTKDCTWADIEEYPEYVDWEADEYIPEFDIDKLSSIKFDKETLENTLWEGYSITNQENGETIYLPVEVSDGFCETVLVSLYSNGKGSFEYLDEYTECEWECTSDDSAQIKLEDGQYITITLFSDIDNDESEVWMMIQVNEDIVWLY